MTGRETEIMGRGKGEPPAERDRLVPDLLVITRKWYEGSR
jgi:hypothetical protein